MLLKKVSENPVPVVTNYPNSPDHKTISFVILV